MMRLQLLLLSLSTAAHAAQYGYNHVTTRRDPDTVSSKFPDINVYLPSPAFLNPASRLAGFANGTEGPTSLSDMQTFMKNLARTNEYMTYHEADFTSEELRPFPYVSLSLSPSRRLRMGRANSPGKVRIWVQGAAHGNEPAGDQALLAILGKFDAYPDWAFKVLENTELIVMPRYNPDGVAYFQRTLATNFDPNRDHIKLARQQTRNIKQLFSKFDPHVVIDMHEYGATTRYGRYYQASDGLFSAAKNLNIHPQIRNISENLFAKNMGNAMEQAGLRWKPYVTGPSSTNISFVPNWDEAGTDGKIGRNAMGLTQAVTFLIEMRGIGIANQEFQRRTAAGVTMAKAIIDTAALNSRLVYETIESGRSAFIRSQDQIVITDYSTPGNRPFTMIDFTTGEIAKVDTRFASTTPANANLTRSRPEAYLIPVAWADLVERLRVGGLQVDRMDAPFSGSVEILNITSSKPTAELYEGVVRSVITTKTSTARRRLPAGSYKVSTRQKNAALAFIALEPENIDSYASFNILPMETGDEYPIYRMMS